MTLEVLYQLVLLDFVSLFLKSFIFLKIHLIMSSS